MSLPALYHMSFNRKLPGTISGATHPWAISPPENEPEKVLPEDPDAWIFKEFSVPHVSFSPTLAKCVQAVYANTHEMFQSPRGLKEGLEFAVYRLDPRSKSKYLTPEELSTQRKVWDAHVTDEYAFLGPVNIYYCGNVIAKVEPNIKGMMVHPFNDKKLDTIKSIVPTADDIRFTQTVRLKGDRYRLSFFTPVEVP